VVEWWSNNLEVADWTLADNLEQVPSDLVSDDYDDNVAII